MRLANQVKCKRCGRAMDTVARIAPMGREYGLIAFLCAKCGDAETVLICRADWTGDQTDPPPASNAVGNR